jgi:hypothetical protein
MKSLRFPALIAIVVLFITSTSCIKTEYYETQPAPQQVGYQYIFDENFNSNTHNWAFSDPGNNAYVDIYNGTLKYTYLPANDGTNTVAIATGANLRNDFLLQTRMQSDNAMGLALAYLTAIMVIRFL